MGTVISFTDYFPAELRRRFDIVGVDPRGVGSSWPVKCQPAVYDPAIPLFPRTQAEYDRLVAHNRAAARGCLAGTGPLLAHVDTASAARDLDVVRSALGEERIAWLGLSYGTMLGAEYAQLFPDRVQRMVLDGAVDRGMPVDRMVVSEAAAVEDEFDRFAAWCDGSPGCALRGRNVIGTWDELMEAATPHPGGRPGRQVTADAMRYLAQFYLNNPPGEQWAAFSKAIDGASRGDASDFWKELDGLARRPLMAPYRAITCLDFSPQLPGGFEQLRARMEEVRRVAPHMGGASELWGITAGCLGWPIPPVDAQQAVRISGIPPALIVSSRHDDATPPAWAESLRGDIAGSQLLVRDGDGHTSYRRSPCATGHIVTYLVTGTLPPAGAVCHD